MNKIQLLSQIPIFSNLKKEELLYLADKTIEKQYVKDSMVLQKGERSGFLGILISGQLKVTLLSPQGREVTLAILNPYDFIGEMSLIDDEPHSANVMALKKSKLLILPRQAFHQLLKENPETCLFLLKHHVKLVRKLGEGLADLKFMDIYQRTAKKLVDMTVEKNEKIIEITHQELANMVGSNRENVTRALNEMERRNLVFMKKGKISIKDLEGVENIYKYLL